LLGLCLGSGICRSPTRSGSHIGYFCEVASQRFESISLLIDLVCSADAAAPEKWHRRTPALQRMLQQERHHRRWEYQQSPIDEGTQQRSIYKLMGLTRSTLPDPSESF
jgi:hypothetical protein